MARINARLDDELAAKLAAIQRATRKTTTEVLREAIERYHESLEGEAGQIVREVFAETGFVGCAEGPADLATAYKAYAAEGFAMKLADAPVGEPTGPQVGAPPRPPKRRRR